MKMRKVHLTPKLWLVCLPVLLRGRIRYPKPEQPESLVLFENTVFRELVAPYLLRSRNLSWRSREDEAVAVAEIQDKLTDEMLLKDFGEAILDEVRVLDALSPPFSSLFFSFSPPFPSFFSFLFCLARNTSSRGR